jgi:hypothetical protein
VAGKPCCLTGIPLLTSVTITESLEQNLSDDLHTRRQVLQLLCAPWNKKKKGNIDVFNPQTPIFFSSLDPPSQEESLSFLMDCLTNQYICEEMLE